MEILCPYCGAMFSVEREAKPGEYMDECPACHETVETEVEEEQADGQISR